MINADKMYRRRTFCGQKENEAKKSYEGNQEREKEKIMTERRVLYLKRMKHSFNTAAEG